ncbi:MAG: ABC transporter permease [Vicinamibacterales bacterium]
MSRPGWMRHALMQLTLLRLREFTREPEALFWGFGFPILLAIGLGVAFRNQPPQILRIAAVTPTLTEALAREPLLEVRELGQQAADDALRTGVVLLVAVPGPEDSVIYRYDDTNPEARTARMIADRAVQVAAGRSDPVRSQDDVARDVGSRYIDFLVPGLVGMGIMGNAIWGLGFSIVDARRRKLMKRIVATPMPRHYYLLSFLMWRMLLLLVEVGVPVGFGVLVFGVPVRGAVLHLTAICVLGSLAFSALGLLIASRARTIEAVSGIMNLVMMPMWILSGVFFSAQRFPDAVQPFIKVLPLTALVDALRANMLRGVGLSDLGAQIVPLVICLVLCFSLALRVFRWR